MNLFRTKSIEELKANAEAGEHKLVRTLRAKDLILLGIGAVIGAGIFSTLGTAAAGEAGVRAGAGPALVISFLLLGAVCGLAGLCYAELTSMIPVSGSAYTYAFATMGELIAWIIGWDLILEYAVGNVAVAIAWSGYFQSVLSYFGAEFPYWLAHGYGDVMQQLHAAQSAGAAEKIALLQGHLAAAPHIGSFAVMLNMPALVIVAAITWLLVRGVKESVRVNNWMVYVKLFVLALF
ncbi:MAG: amino acid permease, partial [Planctomycetota bacterium]|nr:amino acid permease [Planctomycetota bacterium]